MPTETSKASFAQTVSAAPSWLRIQPSRGWTALNLAELWQYRELIYFLGWRDVKVRYKQTIVGVVWVLLQPLAMMAIFWLLFDRMAKLPSDGMPYPLFVLVGVDRSSEMLSIAARKAAEQAVSLHFHQADIRDVELGETFDAVLMMFAVLGYKTEDADVISVLRTARRHVRPDALLVFDVWHGPAVLAQGPQERVRTIENAGSKWLRTSSGRLDTMRHRCHVDFHLRHMHGGRMLEETKECHTIRYFFPEEIELFLDSSGFRLLRLGAFPAFDREPDHTTWNVRAVAVAA